MRRKIGVFLTHGSDPENGSYGWSLIENSDYVGANTVTDINESSRTEIENRVHGGSGHKVQIMKHIPTIQIYFHNGKMLELDRKDVYIMWSKDDVEDTNIPRPGA